MRSIRSYLIITSLALVGLVLAAAALLILEVQRAGKAQSEQQLLATTRALSLVVDGELKRYETLLQVLATSRAVRERNWDELDTEARKLIKGQDAWLVVSDRIGSQLVNTRLPRGSRLPVGPLPKQMWSELDTAQSRICNLAKGRVEPNIICVDVAVPSDGRSDFALSLIMRPAALSSILRQDWVKAGTLTTVIDRHGKIVWRNARLAQLIGRPATSDILAALRSQEEGVQDSRSLEGVPTVAAFSRSKYSGWTFVVAVPRSAFRASGASRSMVLGGTALLLLFGVGVGLLASRRIAQAAVNLASTAATIERGERPEYQPSNLLEIDVAGAALKSAVEARQSIEDRYRLVFEQSSDLILTADLNQVITDCNEAAAKAVGVPRSKAIGRNIAEFISPDDYARTTSMLQRKVAAGGTTRYDVRVRSSEGDWLYWEINSGLMYHPDGTALGLHVVGRDVTDRKRAEEHQQLLIGELNHRVKNTLAIVQALAHQSFKGSRSTEEERSSFEARLATLAAAHNLLTRQSWEAVGLDEVITTAVGAVCNLEGGRFSVQGPYIALPPQSAVSVAMAFHELCTNAVKYGALSNEAGRVTTSWSISQEGDKKLLELEWTEWDGPPVEPPARKGFGTRMIERALAADLSARVDFQFNSEGLVCRVIAPLPEASA